MQMCKIINIQLNLGQTNNVEYQQTEYYVKQIY